MLRRERRYATSPPPLLVRSGPRTTRCPRALGDLPTGLSPLAQKVGVLEVFPLCRLKETFGELLANPHSGGWGGAPRRGCLGRSVPC